MVNLNPCLIKFRNQQLEPLDFCRVKKIDEKGFGFLRGVVYPEDIFFHFSQIKKEEFLEKLNHLKRGDFFLYFTSRLRPDGKRKVEEIWYSLEEVPVSYISDFTQRIINLFGESRTNLYDLLHVVNEMKAMGYIRTPEMDMILESSKVLSLPTTIVPHLNEDELKTLLDNLHLAQLEKLETKPFWYEEMKKVSDSLKK